MVDPIESGKWVRLTKKAARRELKTKTVQNVTVVSAKKSKE